MRAPVFHTLPGLLLGECRYDPELHTGPDAFESEPLAERAARVDVAREICGSCPAWEACMQYALDTRPRLGVWAGHTVRELDELRASARVASSGEAA